MNDTVYFDPVALNYSLLDAQGGQVQFSDVLKDLCVQIDQKILLMATFILIYFVLVTIILPRAKEGLRAYLVDNGYNWLYEDYILKAHDRFVSLLETFALGSSIGLIVIFYYQQGLSLVYIIIYSILGVFVGLTVLAAAVEWIRNIRGKNG